MLTTMPKVTVKLSDLDFNIQSIAELLYDDYDNKCLPFKERVFRAFPELTEVMKDGMRNSEIYDAVGKMMCREY